MSAAPLSIGSEIDRLLAGAPGTAATPAGPPGAAIPGAVIPGAAIPGAARAAPAKPAGPAAEGRGLTIALGIGIVILLLVIGAVTVLFLRQRGIL